MVAEERVGGGKAGKQMPGKRAPCLRLFNSEIGFDSGFAGDDCLPLPNVSKESWHATPSLFLRKEHTQLAAP